MSAIKVIDSNIIYENPKPTLMSRHGFFPGIVELPSGDLVCLFVLGEAFESVDQTTHVARSVDGGKTWRLDGPLYDKSKLSFLSSDYAKPTLLKDGRIIAMGYRFDRSNEGHDLVNVKTGGVRNGQVIVAFSSDNGKTWEDVQVVSLSRSDLLEISGPCVQLQNGDIIAGGPAMPGWETGDTTTGHGGVLLRSTDGGKTWDDSRFYYKSTGDHVSPYETRFTQLEDGTIAAIVWAHNHQTGKNVTNHLVLSNDDGYTWSSPIDTGISAQASNIIGWTDNKLLSIHAHREGADVGLYVRILELGKNNEVKILAEQKIWGNVHSQKIESFIDMSTSLRFGQPSLTKLQNGDVLAVFWSIEDGQGRIKSIRLNCR